ncbi:MAG: hypothetical protein QMB63_09245 [Clostridiaceae bacterium]
MYKELFKALQGKGYFPENDSLTKFKGNVKYTVKEDSDRIIISRPLTDEQIGEGNALKFISSISSRFGIEDARINRDKLEIVFTPPGINTEEEVKRIDYAVEAIDTGLYTYSDTKESNYVPVHQDNEDFTDDEININSQKEPNPVNRGYIPPDRNPYLDPVQQYYMPETGFSTTGLIGAILAAIIGAVLIALLSAVGFYASIVGVITAVLIIKAYNLFSGKNIPIALAIVLVLISVFLGNIFSVAVDMYRYYGVGVTDSLYLGLMAHFDNKNFDVPRVWRSFGLSLLFAALGAVSVFKKPSTR